MARTHEKLAKGDELATQALGDFAGGGLIAWAPQDNTAMQRLAAAFLKGVTRAAGDYQVQLLIPHDTFPDCDAPAAIKDLWWHPLFGDRWAAIVKSVEFLRQPCQCVFTGTGGPLYHIKSFVVVTLSANFSSRAESMIQWRPTLLSQRTVPRFGGL